MVRLVAEVAQALVATGLLAALALGDSLQGGLEGQIEFIGHPQHMASATRHVVKKDQGRYGTLPMPVEGAVQIVATELDTFDPDDTIGKYTRIFSGAPTSWLGRYAPGDEAIDPEDAGAWRVWYRIERA